MSTTENRGAIGHPDAKLTSPHEAFIAATGTRVRSIANLLHDDGACLALIGEPGSGKSYLAHAAFREYETIYGKTTYRVVAKTFDELRGPAGELGDCPVEGAERILAAHQHLAGSKPLLILALRIDEYGASETSVLEELVRTGRARVVCTARQVIGAADRLARIPEVHQLAISPLSTTETEQFLAHLLGVDSIAPETLSRWHAQTRGNQHALVTLALAAERQGIVQRARRVAWILALHDTAPADFISQLGDLSPLEEETLELVAYAAPIAEPALFQLLDAETVSELLRRQILTVHTDSTGGTSLETRLPVLGASIRNRLSPVRRTALAARCFEALNSDEATLSLTTGTRLRIVKFGAEGGCAVPIDWIWNAMRSASRSGDLRLVLTLALAAMPHENPQRSAEAILRAVDVANFLGDRGAQDDALDALTALLEDPARFDEVSPETRVDLAIASIYFDRRYRGDLNAMLEAFSRWDAFFSETGVDAERALQAGRMRVLAVSGQAREALLASSHITGPHTLQEEWHAAAARAFESLLRMQRGEFRDAVSIATTARQISLLHDISPSISGDLEGFAIFLAQWARGTTQSAQSTLTSFAGPRRDLKAVHTQSGLVDLAIVLFAVQEGRWIEASHLTTRLLESLADNDPFSLSAFAHSVDALAYAALGHVDQALAALARSDCPEPGVSLALHGFLRILRLRTHQWLRSPDLVSHALDVAEWARTEDLPLIELEAIDFAAREQATVDPDLLARAEVLAKHIDPPIGSAILDHIRSLASPEGDPSFEERLLAELGLYFPLPTTAQLTGREREIVLFTSLGYSSRQVAERLHLSARTVETHLANAYGKLGFAGRDELRQWFATAREQSAERGE